MSKLVQSSSAADFNLESHVEAVNEFGTQGLWHLGQYLAEHLIPFKNPRLGGRDKLLEAVAAHPRARHQYAFLKQCLAVYSTYPDLPARSLPELFYFDLAVRVFDHELRNEYEQLAIEQNWNITQLRKAIRDGVLTRKEEQRNELGFDLKVTNWWYFNSSDPRFGDSRFKGRIAGQIIANALYYYSREGDVVLDPFAGSATLGDVIDKLNCFKSRRYKLYDLNPSDARVSRNDIFLGLPEPSGTIGYTFLDPPYGEIPKGYYTDQKTDLSRIGNEAFVETMKGLVRECWRVTRPFGRVSIVIEQYLTANSFFDLPGAMAEEFARAGFRMIGKVYLPNQTMRRGDMMPMLIQSAKSQRFMLSDCREMLTYEKPA